MPAIQGQGGSLLVGTRVATVLNAWTMTAIEQTPDRPEPPRLQLVAGGHKPDPVWWPRVSPDRQLYLRIKLGKTEMEKRAVLVNTNPLTLHIWENETDAPS
jgi:hypothetical protein